MSGFGYNNEGLTLKALLENSSYQSAPVNVPKDYKREYDIDIGKPYLYF